MVSSTVQVCDYFNKSFYNTYMYPIVPACSRYDVHVCCV